MPQIDIRQFKKINKKKKRLSRLALILIAIIIVSISGLLIERKLANRSNFTLDTFQLSDQSNMSINGKDGKTNLKYFTPEEFNKLASSIRYPNTQMFETSPAITGNKTADERIRNIAKSRGYEMTSIPISSIVKINETGLEGDDLLQPLAAKSWTSLRSSAKEQNIPLLLVSAYRSPEFQRELFLDRLATFGATAESILSGQSDNAIISVLSQAAIPGFSRHHNGYTIDLWCQDGSGSFLKSSCFKWISDDNYKLAKTNGWIPSYPDGVTKQGPEPEPWEYIWVGYELVRE